MRNRTLLCAVLAFAVAVPAVSLAQSSDDAASLQVPPQLNDAVPERHEIPLYKNPHLGGGGILRNDPILQSGSGGSSAPNVGLGFAGLGSDFPGFTELYVPPDTNGAAGTGTINSQYVQIVNTSFVAFDKTTAAVVAGPSAIHTIWANALNAKSKSLANSCKSNDGGDPIVQFDKINKVWVVMQIQYSAFGGGNGDYICVAVSTGDDWTAPGFGWYGYSMKTSLFPDYPKLGIWTDGTTVTYYVTYNGFKGLGTFAGPVVCGFNGSKMKQGQFSTPVCTSLSSRYFSLLPANIDSGSQLPSAGQPEYLVAMGSNALQTWRYSVNWSSGTASLSSEQDAAPCTTTLSTTTGCEVLSSGMGFQPACGGGTCIPQRNTTQQLDSLGDRLMYRLAYRHFSGYESLVVTQSVTASTTATTTGVRWYELRHYDTDTSTAPFVYQTATYAPADGAYRWLGSAAMDNSGNIAVGYNVSGTNLYPGIAVATRCASDAQGTLGAEDTVLNGPGSQTGSSRWGDYASMSVDPDGSTLWFTTEYASGNTDFWNTRIVKFTISNCP